MVKYDCVADKAAAEGGEVRLLGFTYVFHGREKN